MLLRLRPVVIVGHRYWKAKTIYIIHGNEQAGQLRTICTRVVGSGVAPMLAHMRLRILSAHQSCVRAFFASEMPQKFVREYRGASTTVEWLDCTPPLEL